MIVSVVRMIPPEVVAVGEVVLLMTGYGRLEAVVELEKPLEVPVVYSETELEEALFIKADALPEADEL